MAKEAIELEGRQDLFGKIKLEGIHEGSSGDIKDIITELKNGLQGWFRDIFESLEKSVLDIKDSSEMSMYSLATLEEISKMANKSFNDNNGDKSGTATPKKEEKNEKANVSTRVKIEELNKLRMEVSLPAAAIYWKLVDIENKLGNGSKEKEDDGGGIVAKIKNFLKGLAEGATGFMALSVALLAFSGAMVLFNFIDWTKAIAGMFAFTVFTLAMIVLAKLVKDKLDDFAKLAVGSMLMSAGLLMFAGTLYLASLIASGEPLPIIGSGINMGAALKVIVLFALFTVGMIALSKLMGESVGDFKNLAIASVLMSAGLIVFSVSLTIMTALYNGLSILGLGIVDFGAVFNTMSFFILFVFSFTALAILANEAAGNLKEFTVTTMLMTGSLMLFSVSLAILSFMATGGDIPGLGKVNILAALGMVGLFTLFVGAFTGLAILANSFVPQILIFTVSSVLMSTSLLLFGVALKSTIKAITDESGKVIFGTAMAALASFGIFTAAFAALASGVALLAVPIALGSAVLIVMSTTILLMGFAMGIVTKIIKGGRVKDREGNEENFDPYDKSYSERFFEGFGALLVSMNKAFDGLTLFKAVFKAPLVLVAAEAVLGIANVMSKVSNVQKQLEENPIKPGVFEPIIFIIGQLIDVTKNMSIKGAAALQAAASSSKDIAQALNYMFDTVEKAQKWDFESPEGKKLLDKIAFNMKQVSDVFIDQLLIPTMDKVSGLKKMSEKAIKALPPFMEFLDKITETNNKIVDSIKDPLDVEKIKTMVQSYELLEKVKVPKGLKGFESVKVEKIDKLANSLNKVAESLEKIRKNIPDKSSLEQMASITESNGKSKRKGSVNIEEAPSLSGNGNNGAILYEIKDLLESWNSNTGDREGLYVANLDDISVPAAEAQISSPKRIVKIANAW